MQQASRFWRRLFVQTRPGGCELLLFILLAKAVRDGLVPTLMSPEQFGEAAAFDPVAVDVVPVGWAAFVPKEAVLSQAFHQAVGLMASASCLLWAFKLWLPYSPVISVASYGVLISLKESMLFNYVHETLPTPACMTVFAMFYVLRRREIASALQSYRFWKRRIYPQWVPCLIFLYMGTYYTYAGFSKLYYGGWDAGSGLTLQLQFASFGELSPFARPIVESRVIATALMTMTVVLETGALVAFFLPRVRWVWCLGLIGLHVGVLLSMAIPFKPNIVILAWMATPTNKVVDHLSRLLPFHVSFPRVGADNFASTWRFLGRRLYAVDLFQTVKPT